MKDKLRFYLPAFLLSFGLDLATKIWVRAHLGHGSPTHRRVLIPGFFDLRFAENPGASFGLLRNLPGAQYLLLAVGVVALVALCVWLYRLPAEATFSAGKLGLLTGGALGNMVDRLFHGRVTDFIVWKATIAGRVREWDTFNVADAALVIGVGLLLLNWPRDRKGPTSLAQPGG